MILKLDIATVGEIPKTLMLPDRLSPAQIDWNTVPALLAPAFSIAVLNMLESLLCGASAGRATGVKLNNDQELFAQASATWCCRCSAAFRQLPLWRVPR